MELNTVGSDRDSQKRNVTQTVQISQRVAHVGICIVRRDFILVTGHLFAFPQPANKNTPPTLAITLHQISSLSKQDIQPYYFI